MGSSIASFSRWTPRTTSSARLSRLSVSCDYAYTRCLLLLIIIKTLFTLGLERKIYRNEIITGKDKKVTQASHSRASALQVSALCLPTVNFQPEKRESPEEKTQRPRSSFTVGLKYTSMTYCVLVRHTKYTYFPSMINQQTAHD